MGDTVLCLSEADAMIVRYIAIWSDTQIPIPATPASTFIDPVWAAPSGWPVINYYILDGSSLSFSTPLI